MGNEYDYSFSMVHLIVKLILYRRDSCSKSVYFNTYFILQKRNPQGSAGRARINRCIFTGVKLSNSLET